MISLISLEEQQGGSSFILPNLLILVTQSHHLAANLSISSIPRNSQTTSSTKFLRLAFSRLKDTFSLLWMVSGPGKPKRAAGKLFFQQNLSSFRQNRASFFKTISSHLTYAHDRGSI